MIISKMFSIKIFAFRAICIIALNVVIVNAFVFSALAQSNVAVSSITELSINDSALAEQIVNANNTLSFSASPFKTLLSYQTRFEQERTLVEKLIAARSAWGLGLVDIARSIWDEALEDAALYGIERQRVMFARAIMELQEKNFEMARSMAEKALMQATDSKMKVQLSLLIAESLRSQGALSLSESYYSNALNGADGAQKDEVLFLLADNNYALGRFQEARKRYSEIDVSSEYASRALKKLIEIDFQERAYTLLIPWIEQGRERFASDFEDAWIRYVMTVALIETGELESAEKEYSLFTKWYSENNGWRLLAQAALESAHVKVAFGDVLNSESLVASSVSN